MLIYRPITLSKHHMCCTMSFYQFKFMFCGFVFSMRRATRPIRPSKGRSLVSLSVFCCCKCKFLIAVLICILNMISLINNFCILTRHLLASQFFYYTGDFPLASVVSKIIRVSNKIKSYQNLCTCFSHLCFTRLCIFQMNISRSWQDISTRVS